MSTSLVLRKIAGIAFLSSSFFLILGSVISFYEFSEIKPELFILNFTLLIILLTAGAISLLSKLKAPLFAVLGIYPILNILYIAYIATKYGYWEEGISFILKWGSEFYLPTGYLNTGIPYIILYDLCNLSLLAGAALLIVSSTLSTNDTKIQR
jgi:hypothetical protein